MDERKQDEELKKQESVTKNNTIGKPTSAPKKKKDNKLLNTFIKLAPALLGAVSGNTQAIDASASLFGQEGRVKEEEAKLLEAKRKAALEDRKISQTDRRLDISEDNNKADNARADKQLEISQTNNDRNFGLQEKRVGFEEQRLDNSQDQQVIDNQFSQAKLDNSARALEIQEKNARLRQQEISIKNSQKSAADKTKALEKVTKQKKENRELEIPGVGTALTKDDAKEGKKLFATTKNALATLKSITDLRSEFGGEVFDRSAVQKGKSLAVNLQLILKSKEFAELGVLAGKDLTLLETLVPSDPLQFELTGSTMAKLKEAESLIRTKANTFFESKGLPSPFKKHPKAGLTVKVNGKIFTVGDKGELIE